jgi:hypothetical protein
MRTLLKCKVNYKYNFLLRYCQLSDDYFIFSLSKITSTKFYVEVVTSANSVTSARHIYIYI